MVYMPILAKLITKIGHLFEWRVIIFLVPFVPPTALVVHGVLGSFDQSAIDAIEKRTIDKHTGEPLKFLLS